jgi:4-oxalocrotonate tautomerase
MITAGTNTKEETTAFVKAAYEGMQALLGPLHEECYGTSTRSTVTPTVMPGALKNGRWAVKHPG